MQDNDVIRAAAFAKERHGAQTDKAGAPYFGHLERVASRMDSPLKKVVALLHDVLEDTETTYEELKEQFGEEVATAVEHLTKREGESYEDFVRRAGGNPLSREVKISDLIDNSNLGRLKTVTVKDVERQKKYCLSLLTLLSE